MKQLLISFLIAILLLAGVTNVATQETTSIRVCSSRDPSETERAMDQLQNSPLFNKRLDVQSLNNTQRSQIEAFTQYLQQAVMKEHTWTPGTTLKIAFLSGDPVVQQRIKTSAMGWTTYANIHFLFVDDASTAAIRIGISLDNKSWSCIGTDALKAPPQSETMHFGWLTAASSQADYDSVVLHEFGHALGLLHEHQIPSSTIIWNKPVVYNYCTSQLGWSNDDVDHNIFEKYTPDQAIFTRMDPESIMMYSYPASWTLNNPPLSTPWNYKLSDADKQFITLQYPLPVNGNGALAPK